MAEACTWERSLVQMDYLAASAGEELHRSAELALLEAAAWAGKTAFLRMAAGFGSAA